MSEVNKWDSPLSFILAMVGAAVGLGNIWRFSYVLYSNGGGAFFIPYLVAIFLMGIPFLILEYGIGFSYKDSFPNIFKKINPKLELVSWILVLIVFMVGIYYVVIVGWDLIYLISSANFSWGNNPALYFANSVGGNNDLSHITSFMIPTLIAVLVIWFLVWYISHKDLSRGIGRFSKIIIPALFLMMAIIIVYSIFLPGSSIGINTLLNPDWNSLTKVEIWLAAFSQILFSLSMGQAIAMSYASYLPEKARLIDDVFVVVACNCLFEIFTAFGIFSVLGYMSATSGTPMVQLVSEGTGLVFIVFPTIFNMMGPVGHIFAPFLFIAILFAGITSAMAIIEPMVNSIMHKFDWTRKKTVTVLACIGCCLSLIFTTGAGSYLIEVVDTFLNNFCLILLIAIQCIVFTRYIDMDSLMSLLNKNSKFKVDTPWIYIIKYILPVCLLFMWIWGVFDLIGGTDMFELAVFAVLTVVILVTSRILSKAKSKN
ncbi:sodium-dependent transporter [Methanobrevibacter sp.]|uniref:sodium-dependent transporter n=1 Tax=Methanobrevibacter sp. TaxID=66852 RepID=UPI00388ED341